MATFQENLATLPAIEGIARLELTAADGSPAGIIENRPGSQGSLRVYQALAGETGQIDPVAAAEGLRLFAEHTDDARRRPGAHPNIDRLLALAEGDAPLRVTVIREA